MKFRDWLNSEEGQACLGADRAAQCKGPAGLGNISSSAIADDWDAVLCVFRGGLRQQLRPEHCQGDLESAVCQYNDELKRIYFDRYQELRGSANFDLLAEQAFELGELTSATLRLHRGEGASTYPKNHIHPTEKLGPIHLAWARDLLGHWFHKNNETWCPVDVWPDRDLPTSGTVRIREFDKGCVLC